MRFIMLVKSDYLWIDRACNVTLHIEVFNVLKIGEINNILLVLVVEVGKITVHLSLSSSDEGSLRLVSASLVGLGIDERDGSLSLSVNFLLSGLFSLLMSLSLSLSLLSLLLREERSDIIRSDGLSGLNEGIDLLSVDLGDLEVLNIDHGDVDGVKVLLSIHVRGDISSNLKESNDVLASGTHDLLKSHIGILKLSFELEEGSSLEKGM